MRRLLPVLLVVALLTFAPAPGARAATTRIAGNDRYATSAAISASGVAPGTSVVYVASGADFPDALAAAPVAGTRRTSVLLVGRDSVPDAVKTELQRIKPPTIHVVGGKGSVSDAVVDQLKPFATQVDRIAGANRYETAANVSLSFFKPDLAFVYIATGEAFADALAAGAAAVDRGAVLLVTSDAIPSATAAALENLTPQEIIVVGGSGAISDSVVQSLGEYTDGPVTRQAGADRYATSAIVSSKAFQPPTDAVYLASGASFADALSGGPIAGANDGPVLLVHRDCATDEVLAEISRLDPGRHVIFGGTAAVADGADTARCGVTSTAVTATGLDTPWDVAFTPTGTAFITERGGRLLRRDTPNGPLVTIQQVAGAAEQGEGGLLGLEYRDGFLYAYMTTATDNRIVRFRPGETPVPILTGIAKASNHNAGRIRFGPDGLLYAGTGDAADPSRAQNPASLNGKILRIRADGTIPAGNISASSPVYALGFRDPQGLAWDTKGRLYVSEFGPDRDDEVNIVVPGGNYGWDGTRTGIAKVAGFVDPIIVRQPSVASWSGDAIVHGGITEWDGDLLVAALRGTRLYRFDLAADGTPIGGGEELFVGTYGRLRVARQAPDGSLWILTSNRDGRGTPTADDDRIIRISRTG